MKGFREFLLRGNLIELAVAFIMGTVFAAVVQSFTTIILDILGLLFEIEGLSGIAVAGVNIGDSSLRWSPSCSPLRCSTSS